VKRLCNLWDTGQKSENGPSNPLASAKAGTDSSHKGLLSKPLNRKAPGLVFHFSELPTVTTGLLAFVFDIRREQK
jgi:hypothetical protein